MKRKGMEKEKEYYLTKLLLTRKDINSEEVRMILDKLEIKLSNRPYELYGLTASNKEEYINSYSTLEECEVVPIRGEYIERKIRLEGMKKSV